MASFKMFDYILNRPRTLIFFGIRLYLYQSSMLSVDITGLIFKLLNRSGWRRAKPEIDPIGGHWREPAVESHQDYHIPTQKRVNGVINLLITQVERTALFEVHLNCGPFEVRLI